MNTRYNHPPMIRYLKYQDIDKQKWDDCIHHAINSLPYALSWVLDIVSPGWDALISDDYVAVFPLTHRKKWGINYLFPPPFTQQMGLFSRKEISDKEFTQFYNAIPKQYKFIDIKTNWQNASTMLSAEVKFNKNLTLNLNSDYKTIREKYSKSLKRNLCKAEKENLFLHVNSKPEELTQLFIENKGKKINSIKKREYILFHRICYQAIYKGLGRIISVSDSENNLCASAFFFHYNQRIIFLFSGLSETGKIKGAMPYLIDSVIREFSGNNIIFDFEGSNNINLARFYQSFGADESFYFHIQEYRFPSVIQPFIRLFNRIKTELRK